MALLADLVKMFVAVKTNRFAEKNLVNCFAFGKANYFESLLQLAAGNTDFAFALAVAGIGILD